MVRRRNTKWEDMDRSNIDLSVLIQHYEVHNRTEGKSPRTVQWYNEVLSMLQGWIEAQGMSTILNAIGEMAVRGFILHVQSRPGLKGVISPNTVNNRVTALRAFFAWLDRKGYTTINRLERFGLGSRANPGGTSGSSDALPRCFRFPSVHMVDSHRLIQIGEMTCVGYSNQL